jgi:hypothetical protein
MPLSVFVIELERVMAPRIRCCGQVPAVELTLGRRGASAGPRCCHCAPAGPRRKAVTQPPDVLTLASVTGGRLTIRRRPSTGALLAPADCASGRSQKDRPQSHDVSFIFCWFDHLRRTNGAVPCADNLVHHMRVYPSPRAAILSCAQATERHLRAGNAGASAGVCGTAGRQLLVVGVGASTDYTMGYRRVACRFCAILHLVLHPDAGQNSRRQDVRNPTRVCGTRKSDWHESPAENLALSSLVGSVIVSFVELSFYERRASNHFADLR